MGKGQKIRGGGGGGRFTFEERALQIALLLRTRIKRVFFLVFRNQPFGGGGVFGGFFGRPDMSEREQIYMVHLKPLKLEQGALGTADGATSKLVDPISLAWGGSAAGSTETEGQRETKRKAMREI